MKDQYYGDINDYWTYGLLRVLQARMGWSIGICWMRSAPDGRNDGNKISYLSQPERYQAHDPALFQALSQSVQQGRRALSEFEQSGLLPASQYFGAPVPLDRAARAEYWQQAQAQLSDCDLVFFDPDNGLAIASVARGARQSDKYLWLDEAEPFFTQGQRLLLFQHFPRTQREPYLAMRAQQLRAALQANDGSNTVEILSFSHAHVSFLLVIKSTERDLLKTALQPHSAFFGHLRWH